MVSPKYTVVSVIAMSMVVGAALTGCSGTPAKAVSASPAVGTVKGTLTVNDPDNIDASSQGTEPCSVLSGSGYNDVQQGAEVDAVDASGKVLAFASLQPGSTPSDAELGKQCAFPFTISGVPHGKKIYGLQFGRRGTIHYKESVMFSGHADITLGN